MVEDHLLACETGLEANQVAFWQQKRSRMLFCNILLTPPSPGATRKGVNSEAVGARKFPDAPVDKASDHTLKRHCLIAGVTQW